MITHNIPYILIRYKILHPIKSYKLKKIIKRILSENKDLLDRLED